MTFNMQSGRGAALWRFVVGVVFLLVIIPVVLPVVVAAFIILAILDIALQLVTGGGGGRIPLMGWVQRVWDWIFGNLIWSFTGSGRFKLLP